MNGPRFQAKWRGNALTERAAFSPHLNDLRALFGVPIPTEFGR